MNPLYICAILLILGEATIVIEGHVPPQATQIKLIGDDNYALTMISHEQKGKPSLFSHGHFFSFSFSPLFII